MPRELKDATITHVSYVDKAANKKKFFLTKSEAAPTFEKEVRLITKADDAEQLVYGIVYEPNVEDAHGDFMNPEEIEKAAHTFLKEYRQLDTQHDFKSGVGEVVESYIAPEDFVVGTETIAKGSWVMVTKASDDIWEQIQKGDITGYSMAGTAEAIEKAEEDDKQMKSFFNTLKAFFTNGGKEEVQKGKVKDQYQRDIKNRNLWTALDTFAYSIKKYNWETDEYEYDSDEDIRTAISDLTEILNDVLLSDNVFKAMGKPTTEIAKAGKKISAARMEKLQSAQAAIAEILAEVDEPKEEEEVNEEQLAKALEKALEPINEKLSALEKANGEVQEQVENVKKEEGEKPAAEDIVKQLDTALEKALAPINSRIEAVEKARGIKKSEENEGEQTQVQKSESVFSGLFFK